VSKLCFIPELEGLPYQRRSPTNAEDMGVLPLFINYPVLLLSRMPQIYAPPVAYKPESGVGQGATLLGELFYSQALSRVWRKSRLLELSLGRCVVARWCLALSLVPFTTPLPR